MVGTRPLRSLGVTAASEEEEEEDDDATNEVSTDGIAVVRAAATAAAEAGMGAGTAGAVGTTAFISPCVVASTSSSLLTSVAATIPALVTSSPGIEEVAAPLGSISAFESPSQTLVPSMA